MSNALGIVESLEEDGRVKMDFLHIDCQRGKPVISGRVVNDEALHIIDEVLSDVLDIDHFENTAWVDDTLAFDGNEDEADGCFTGADHE